MKFAPVPGQRGARRRLGRGERRRRPGLVVLLEQRQIEQPLARVVDDLHVQQAMLAEPPPERALDREAQLQAERAQALGRRRPARLGRGERRARLLEREARQIAREVRQQPRAEQPVLLHRDQERQLARLQQMVRRERDEHRLAAAAQAGHRQPEGAVEREVGQVPEPLLPLRRRSQAGQVLEAVPDERGRHQAPVRPARIARQTIRPSSRLLRKRRRQERGSSMSRVRTCQAKWPATATSSR